MKKDCSEYQQRILKKLVRFHKPSLPAMSTSSARKHTFPAQVGKRTTRSEAAKLRAEANTQAKMSPLSKAESKYSEDSNESTDSQSESKYNSNVSSVTSDNQSDMASQQETVEEKTGKKPRKKRISRAHFRHDKIDFIKPEKQDFLQKSFSFKFKKLVDKSKEIYSKHDEQNLNETENDSNKEITIDDMDSRQKLTCGPKYLHNLPKVGEETLNKEQLILDMPSLDSPRPHITASQTEDKINKIERKKHPPVQVSHGKTIEKTNINSAQVKETIKSNTLPHTVPRDFPIQNNSQNLAYALHNVVPKQNTITNEQKTVDQIPHYKITIVSDPLRSENQAQNIKITRETKRNDVTDRYMKPSDSQMYSYPHMHINPYGYPRTYSYLPPQHLKNRGPPIWNPHVYQANCQQHIDPKIVNNHHQNNLKHQLLNLEHRRLNILEKNSNKQQKLENLPNKNFVSNMENFQRIPIQNLNQNDNKNQQYIVRNIYNPNCTIVKEQFVQKNINSGLEKRDYSVNYLLSKAESQTNTYVPKQLKHNTNQQILSSEQLNKNPLGNNYISAQNIRNKQVVQDSNSNQSSRIALENNNASKLNRKTDLEFKIPQNLIQNGKNFATQIPLVQNISHRYQNNCPQQNIEQLNHSNLKITTKEVRQKQNIFEKTKSHVENIFSAENKNIIDLEQRTAQINQPNCFQQMNHLKLGIATKEGGQKIFEKTKSHVENVLSVVNGNIIDLEQHTAQINEPNCFKTEPEEIKQAKNIFDGTKSHLSMNENIARDSQKRPGTILENILIKSPRLDSNKNDLVQPINYKEKLPITVNKTQFSSNKQTSDSVIVNPNRQTSEQRVIVMNSDLHRRHSNIVIPPEINNNNDFNIMQSCSVIKHTQSKNKHTIENILSHKCSSHKNSEINNNNFVPKTTQINILNVENIYSNDPRYHRFENSINSIQKSVIINAPKEKTKSFECETLSKPPNKIINRRRTLLHIDYKNGINEKINETPIYEQITPPPEQKTPEPIKNTYDYPRKVEHRETLLHFDYKETNEKRIETQTNEKRIETRANDQITPPPDPERQMPELIKISDDHRRVNRAKTNDNQNNYASTVPSMKHAHYTVDKNYNKDIGQPLNLSLKTDVQTEQNKRQSIIVNSKKNNQDPLDPKELSFVKSDDDYNDSLKLLEENNAHGPYLFYKFISNFRKRLNQPIFDLVTFFSLLKQGKLYEYKNLYNQYNR